MNKFVLKDVSVFHKDAGTLLDHISFSVPEEGIFSILGETGSGKTLLVKIMVGLRPYGMKTEGEVIYYEDKSYSILKLSKKKIHLLRGSSLLWIPYITFADASSSSSLALRSTFIGFLYISYPCGAATSLILYR